MTFNTDATAIICLAFSIARSNRSFAAPTGKRSPSRRQPVIRTSTSNRHMIVFFDNFREECRHLLEVLRDVYRNDAVARECNMSPEQRLAWHQAETAQLMGDLWGKPSSTCKSIGML